MRLYHISLRTEAHGVIPIPLPTHIAARSLYTNSAGAPKGPSTLILISPRTVMSEEIIVVICSIPSVTPTLRANSSVQSPTHLICIETYVSDGAEVIVNGCH